MTVEAEIRHDDLCANLAGEIERAGDDHRPPSRRALERVERRRRDLAGDPAHRCRRSPAASAGAARALAAP